MANEFDQLLPCSWRGIQFPTSSVDLSFEQDLAEHKYYGIDGASVEATGRGPIHVRVTIPLVNGIVPGKNEKWGTLYPDTFRDLFRALIDRKSGVFIHPELDQILCRVKSVNFSHQAQQRDGVNLIVEFIETVEDDITVEFQSPVTVAELAALDLDASGEDLRALVPEAYQMPFTLNDFINSLTAVGDQFTIQSKLALGKIDSFIYHMNRLEDSVNRARSAATWPVLDGIQKAKSALRDIQEKPPATLPILLHTVRGDVSLGAILTEIPGAQFGDVIRLNPGIMASPIIRTGTVIRYHDRG